MYFDQRLVNRHTLGGTAAEGQYMCSYFDPFSGTIFHACLYQSTCRSSMYMYIRGLIQQNFSEFAKAVPIDAIVQDFSLSL